MSKQDAVAARTAEDLERKYNYGRTFAELYGLSIDAQNAAASAEESANRAEEAVEAIDHEAVFNLLTKDGELQGFYEKDGKLYINAEFVQIVNLIAETVLSKDEYGGSMEIRGGIFRMYQDKNILVEVSTEYEGYPVMRLTRLQNGVNMTRYEMGPDGFQVVDLTGEVPATKFAAQLDMAGNPTITCKNTSGDIITKKVEWKSNGDGTYALIGR